MDRGREGATEMEGEKEGGAAGSAVGEARAG